MVDGLIGAAVGIVVFVVVMALHTWLSAMRDRAMNAKAAARRRERQEQLGPIARAETASAEELAQMQKDRQDFFGMLIGPYLGTAQYNSAQEQAILEAARRYAAIDGVSLKKGMQRYYLAQSGSMRGTAISYSGRGTIGADEVCKQGGTPAPREYRP